MALKLLLVLWARGESLELLKFREDIWPRHGLPLVTIHWRLDEAAVVPPASPGSHPCPDNGSILAR